MRCSSFVNGVEARVVQFNFSELSEVTDVPENIPKSEELILLI